MLIPLRSDAPLYHKPIATIGVGVVCAAVSIAAWMEIIDVEHLVLQYDVIRPHQWVTSNFVHGGIMHLVGNLIFLWIFGLIVEGKVGALRFLAIFLAIAVPQCAFEQLVFSGGASFGASAVVFGLIGISLIWAPLNEVTFVWFLWWHGSTFDMTVRTTAIWYAIWELFGVLGTFLTGGFHVTSEVLHLMGLVIGVAIGVWMLNKRMVDCEGWDLFSVRRGDHRQGVVGGSRSAEATRAAALAEKASPADEQRRAHLGLRRAVSDADAESAVGHYGRLRGVLERGELTRLANLFYDAESWDAAAAALSELRRRFPDSSPRVSLRRAEIAIRHEQRPAAALALLESLPTDGMNAGEARTHARLVAAAQSAAANAPLELADDDL